MNIESSGQATWKRKQDAKGAEADSCFHIAAARHVIGKDELDLDRDPPPDLAVEIDVSNQSLSKLPIYSAFSVAEIWRYLPRKNVMQIYVQHENSYIEAESSLSFPILTREVLAEFVQKSARLGQTQALASFRQWLRRQLDRA
jgi:Uma2 family endonuclease